MPNEQQIEYLTNNTELGSIADAIRTKGGTSAQLVYPAGFVSAINAIETGGGISTEDVQNSTGTGIEISGDMASTTLVPYVIRPDATLIGTHSYDKMIHSDEKITIGAYTTTDTTLKSSWNIDTYTLDYDTYSYIVAVRGLSIPSYSVTSKAKGRMEYSTFSYLYEITRIPANTYRSLVDPDKYLTTRSVVACAYAFSRALYYSSATDLSTASVNYGTYQTPTSPGISGTTLTIKSPALKVRGSATYYASTYMNATTDIRYQFVIDVYRAENGNLNIDGFGTAQQMLHVLSCVNSTNMKLT